MKWLNQIAWILVLLLFGVVTYQYFNAPEIPDAKIKALEDTIFHLSEKVKKKEATIDSLAMVRDSLYVRISDKSEEDRVLIHEKYEKSRADVLLLSDDESVRLFAKNLAGG